MQLQMNESVPLAKLNCKLAIQRSHLQVRLATEDFFTLLLHHDSIQVLSLRTGSRLFQAELTPCMTIHQNMIKQGELTIFISEATPSGISVLLQKLQKEVKKREGKSKCFSNENHKQDLSKIIPHRRKKECLLEEKGHKGIARRRPPTNTISSPFRHRKKQPPKTTQLDETQLKKAKMQALQNMPIDLLANIFTYAKGKVLPLRLISKHFAPLVLVLVGLVRLHPEIPQSVFNRLSSKLTRIDVGRGRNLHAIPWNSKWKHLDLSNFKSLIDKQLDLRRCWLQNLVVPYYSKITVQPFLAMPRSIKTLKLKPSRGQIPEYRNMGFHDYELSRVLNNHYYLLKFEIAWLGSSALAQLKPQTRQRLQKLTIGTLELQNEGFDWAFFQSFSSLTSLSIYRVHHKGRLVIDSIKVFKLPPRLVKLKLGEYIESVSLSLLERVTHLKIVGSQFLNEHVVGLNFVPEVLDIRGCENITSNILQHMSKGEVRVSWDRCESVQANILSRFKSNLKIKTFRPE